MSHGYHALSVLSAEKHTGGMAKTVSFEIPDALKSYFSWRAGQHLSLRFMLSDQEVRRSYSISSSPVSGAPLQITVKRVKEGLVSNHINDRVEAGDTIDVMPPFGAFCLDAAQNQRRTYYFFAAGSGITPLYAMLHTVMCQEPHSVANLLYGNKTKKSTLFGKRLADLEKNHAERLTVSHVLSSPSWLQGDDCWYKGKIDAAAVEAFINEFPPYAQDAQYYICGPAGMNAAVKAALMTLDVPLNRIHMESYGANIALDKTVNGVSASASIVLNGEAHEVAIAENETVLEASRRCKLAPPFSCQSGVCGACRARLLDGTVHMRARMALADSEIDTGAILTCHAVPTSNKLTIDYG